MVRLSEFVGTEMDAMGQIVYGLFNGLTNYTSHVVKSSIKVFGNSLGHPAAINMRGFTYLAEV